MALLIGHPNLANRPKLTALNLVRGGTLLLFISIVSNSFAQSTPQFEKQVLPILGKYCLTCHGPPMQIAKLDLRTLSTMMRGGEQGPALVKGWAEKSRLYQRIVDKSMPPTEGKVTDDEARIVRDWIDSGARTAAADGTSGKAESAHWAFQPPLRPPAPGLTNTGRHHNPIDACVVARLGKAGISPPSPA